MRFKVFILIVILNISCQEIAYSQVQTKYEEIINGINNVQAKLSVSRNKYLKSINDELESRKKSISDLLVKPTTFCSDIVTEASNSIETIISDISKKICKNNKKNNKCIPKAIYNNITPELENIKEKLVEDSDENSFLDICESSDSPLGCLTNQEEQKPEITTTNNDIEIIGCNSNEKFMLSEILQSNKPTLSSTTKVDTKLDLGNIEFYKYSLHSGDIYVVKNDSYLPLEAQVKLQSNSTNVIAEIPQLISLLPKEQQFAFKICVTNSAQPWNYDYTYNEEIGFSKSTHTGSGKYLLPFKSGETYIVNQGETGSFSHTGNFLYSIDFDLLEGTEFTAMRNGTVVFIKEDSNEGGADKSFEDKANFIWVLQSDNSIAKYVHLQQNGAIVNLGDSVKAGDVLGYSGNTGYTSGPHLHVQVILPKGLDGEEKIPIRFNGIDGALVEGSSYTAYPICK